MNFLRAAGGVKPPKNVLAAAIGAAVLLVIAIASVISCRTNHFFGNEDDMKKALAVKTVKAELKDYCEAIESFGTISFKTKTDITSFVDGTAIAFFVKQGDFVERGKIVGVMRNIQLENQRDNARNAVDAALCALEAAKNRLWDMEIVVKRQFFAIDKIKIQIAEKNAYLALLEKNLQNAEELLALDGITLEAYKNAEHQYYSALSELHILEVELEDANLGMLKSDLLDAGILPSNEEKILKEQIMSLNTRSIRAEIAASQVALKNAKNTFAQLDALVSELTLKAPVTGIVGAIYFENGEYIKQNEKVFTIIDTREVYAVFSIQENDIINFAIGSPLEIQIDSIQIDPSIYPPVEQTVSAKIDEISPIADFQNGSFQVKALIQNPDNAIKPGMFVKCAMEKTQHEQLVALPESAVVSEGKGGQENEAVIFCVAGKTAIKKHITVKTHGKGFIWASAGLDAGETVIDNPSPFLKEGRNVIVL